jgi:hypothetical protein
MAELRSYDPTWRQRLQATMQDGLERMGMNRYRANELSYNITGGGDQNMGLGLLDITPAGAVFGVQEGSRAAREGYNMGGVEGAVHGGLGVLEAGLNALPGAKMAAPAVKRAAGVTRDAVAAAMRSGAPQGAPQAPVLLSQFNAGNYPHAKLPGLPDRVMVDGRMVEFGTDRRIEDLAKQYMSDRGLLYAPQPHYADVDVERAKRIAQAYEQMKNDPLNPNVKAAYDALIEETMGQYETLRRAGYNFDFYPESGDPYGNPRNAVLDIVQNKNLKVFPTDTGFGGSITGAADFNPLLLNTGEKWNGKPVLANDMFRAVHDVFGHAKHGVGFRAGGEENAWQAHARMFSPRALPAATSETRGQNSWVNFGPYGKFNKSAAPDVTEYAEQKVGELPAWVYTEGLLSP